MLAPGTRLVDFPALAGQAYLNTAAECIPPRATLEAVQAYLADKCAGMNGREAHFARAEDCRRVAARLVGLEPGDVAFCSCSSEAYNLLARGLRPAPGDEVIVSDLDFPAGATPWLVEPRAARVRLWKSRGGRLEPDDLAALLSPRTRLVQVSLVSFWNGHRLDWDSVRDTVRARSPAALLAVDVTQALGRIERLCPGADVIVSSTHKWALGIHGGCVVGLAPAARDRVRPDAGGWFHVANAFDPDRFDRVAIRPGAAGFAVGMPNFAAIYALEAGLSYLERTGLAAIAAHADPLAAGVHAALLDLDLEPMCPWEPARPSGIVAFRHPDSAALHARLEREAIRVMHHAGRIRIAVHGYNTADDVARAVAAITAWRRAAA
jgi:cysteine desulfurase/selenocysteine lyase